MYLCCLLKKAAHNGVKNITEDNFYFYLPAKYFFNFHSYVIDGPHCISK